MATAQLSGGVYDVKVDDVLKNITARQKLAEQIRDLYLERWKIMLLASAGEFMIDKNRSGQLTISREILGITGQDPFKVTEYRPWFNVNLLSRIYLQISNSYLGVSPYFLANPGSGETNDIIAAQMGQHIADGIITPELLKVQIDLLWWFLWCDTTLVKTTVTSDKYYDIFDPTEEDQGPEFKYIAATEVGNIQLRKNGKPLWIKKGPNGEKLTRRIVTKELTYRVIPPSDFLIDPGAKGINAIIDPKSSNAARWIIHTLYLNSDELEAIGLNPDDYKPESGFEVDKTSLEILNIYGLKLPDTTEKLYKYNEFTGIPTHTYEKGCFIKYIGNKVVNDKITPLTEPFDELGRLPYVDFRDSPAANGIRGKTRLTESRIINKEVCTILSKMRSLADKVGDKTAFIQGDIDESSVVPTANLGALKNIIKTDYGASPVITEINTIPMFMLRWTELLLQLLEYVSITVDIKNPDRERTATEIIQLIAKNEDAQSTPLDFYAKRIITLGEYGIETIKCHYTPDQKVEITGGEFDPIEVAIWNKTPLVKGKFNYQLGIGRNFTTSKIGRMQFLKDLFSFPQFAQTLTPEKIASYLMMDELVEDVAGATDRRRQRQELINIRADDTYEPKVESFDNHKIHIEEINVYIKNNYRLLEPVQIQRMLKHREFHEVADENQLIKEAQKQARIRAALQPPQPPSQPTPQPGQVTQQPQQIVSQPATPQ